eukprot:6590602-Prymnesium_polylepis.1
MFESRVALVRTTFRGHAAGAILSHTTHLDLVECSFRDNHAPSGGAVLVSGSSDVMAARCHFTGNEAVVSGGALQ